MSLIPSVDPSAARWLKGREAAFRDFVAARTLEPLATAQPNLTPRVDDLALVFGCLAGDVDALQSFQGRILSRVTRDLRRSNLVLDVDQELMTRLFVADGKRGPRALRYQGRGTLLGWVRVTARNLVTSFHRLHARAAHELVTVPIAPELGPEDLYFTREASLAFRKALEGAVAHLDARERELLRVHHVENQSVQQIAARYRVHRETSGTWIRRARARLVTETRRRLQSGLGVSKRGAESMIRSAIGDCEANLANLLLRHNQ